MNGKLSALQEAQHEFWASNLAHLLEFIEGLKDESLLLDAFNDMTASGRPIKPKVSHTCSSVACIGGWVAVMPYFKELGIRRSKDNGNPEYGDNVQDDEIEAASFFLFGVKDMFDSRCDEEEIGKHSDKSDREIAIRRIKKRLKAVRKLEEDRLTT